MKMEEAGLIDYLWRRYSVADPTPCLSDNIIKAEDKKKKSEPRKRLTLKGLSGAFVILIAGHVLAFLAFIIECSIARMRKQYRANKINPSVKDVESKQKDVEAPTSKIDNVKVNLDVNLKANMDTKNKAESDSNLEAEKSKVVITAAAAAVSPQNKEINNQENIVKTADITPSRHRYVQCTHSNANLS